MPLENNNEINVRNPDDFKNALVSACTEFNQKLAEELCGQLVFFLRSSVEQFPLETGKNILKALRKKRYFSLMTQVADAFLRTGLDDAQIKRQYAQALLDQGMVYAALPILREIEGSQAHNTSEWAESLGLIGRAFKQIYIDANDSRPRRNRDALVHAIKSYLYVYQTDPEKYPWHGVNTISLICRAKQDGLDVKDFPDPTQMANKIIERIKEMEIADKAAAYDLASAAEAYVAINDVKKAAEYLVRYVEKEGSDAFELESTRRQFEEVLKCNTDDKKMHLLEILNSGIIAKSGGSVSLANRPMQHLGKGLKKDAHSLEKILGIEGPISYGLYMTGLQRALYVGCVWDHKVYNFPSRFENRSPVGTGFIIPGNLLIDNWQHLQVFVTNNHVVSANQKYAPDALSALEAEITFEAFYRDDKDAPRFKIREILWESMESELDITCLRLDNEFSEIPGFPVANELPSQINKDSIYVIGHPGGGELSFSIQDSHLLDYNENRIHYRSPTSGGSSGSPLFNQKWDLIGVHHAGGFEMRRIHGKGEYPANEGIPIIAIKKELKKQFG